MSLSDKQKTAINGYGYDEEDVKEFIQDIKEQIFYITEVPEKFNAFCTAINKLAGDKLI